MMVAVMLISRVAGFVGGGLAILLLVIGTFGLDSVLFGKKRKTGRDPRAPKERVRYIVEEEAEPEETETSRTRR